MTIIVSSAPAGIITVQPGDRTPASIVIKNFNIENITTSDVPEGVNLYYTNVRVIGSLTAGGNITIDANGRINSSATGGGSTDTLATVTNRGNVTTNGITVKAANANYFAVNTSAGFTVTTGQIAWNATDLTFDMGMANGVTLQVGQEQYIRVKAGSAISDGQAIMFAGANGEHIIAVPNDATTAGYIPEWFIGIATQDIAINGVGYITTFGKVHNINTLAWNEGDILYADPTTVGGLVNIEPVAPYPNIVVAAVIKRAGGDGHLMVRPNWRSDLHQLNDVFVNGVTDGQVLTYQNNVWYNRSTTSANVTELTNLYYTNARAIAAVTNTSLSNLTVSGNVTATNFIGSGSGLTGVALKTSNSWTVTTGTNIYSFTVPASGTYQLWVECNIPNGILVWNATATITNSNVPVVGAQYAWVYNGGGSPVDFTSIPNQFTGTANTIVRSSGGGSSTTNKFDFGINNSSGGSITVRYGWVAIS